MVQQKAFIDKIIIRTKAITVVAFIILAQQAPISAVKQQQHYISTRSLPLWLGNVTDTYSNRNVSSKLDNLLKRIGPNMRVSSNYNDFTDIHLNESMLAWRHLHDQAKKFAVSQVNHYGPHVDSLLKQAQVSDQCLGSVLWVLKSMRELDSRAIQMWSSTGNFPPVGVFDGQFTDMGSYCGCLDIKMQIHTSNSTSGSAKNQSLTVPQYTSYCNVAFRPLVPTRRRFHMIFQEESEDLRNMFNRTDAFTQIARWAQYFHYVYFKTGICVPYDCHPIDVQQIANLVARRLFLTAGPVKCFTHAPYDPTIEANLSSNSNILNDLIAEDNRPVLVNIGRPLNDKQLIAATILIIIFLLPLLATVWHAIDLWRNAVLSHNGSLVIIDYSDQRHYIEGKSYQKYEPDPDTNFANNSRIKFVTIEYLSLITNWKQFKDTTIRSNEIKCLHGLRVISMIWIICVHTLQYNEWSGFTRIFRIVDNLQNPFLHPMFNANYVVDNFFLMSGLLVSYTTWFSQKGSAKNFSPTLSLLGRYLRLTPQVVLVSLMYIVLPVLNHGPFWYDMTHDPAVFCEKNWWINMLHLQSFYKSDQMCNLVSWWISVDMLYYIIALVLVFLILNQRTKIAILCTAVCVGYCTLQAAYQHYTGGFTPNNLGTVPQVAEVWSNFIVKFVWSPFPHAFPFYLGLWVGYMLANKKWQHNVVEYHRLGWFVATISIISVSLSSHIWMSGRVELANNPSIGTEGMHQSISTAYNIICTIVWALGFAWIIVACHYGCAPNLNKFLSIDIFVLLSKASFIIYLSHMLIIRAIFGSQYTLLEVSLSIFTYLMIGNIIASILFGIFLNVAFESPCMKFQRSLINRLKIRGGTKSYPMSLATATTFMTAPSSGSRNGLGAASQATSNVGDNKQDQIR